MEFRGNNISNFQCKFDKNGNDNSNYNDEHPSYLYPNGHRITPQMRWFKGSKCRGLKSDFAEQIGDLI